jgi:hypothetical protein
MERKPTELVDLFEEEEGQVLRNPKLLWLMSFRMSRLTGGARESAKELICAEKDRQLNIAQSCVERAREWALPREAMEPLCWSHLLTGRISLEKSINIGDVSFVHRAMISVDEGIRLAKSCGFGLYFIDLLLLRAQCLLSMGDEDAAIRSAQFALYGSSGIQAHIPFKGMPATDRDVSPGFPLHIKSQECGYVWADAEARHLLAEGLLLKAAKLIGTARTDIKTISKEAEELVSGAVRELEESSRLRVGIKDPKKSISAVRLVEARAGLLTRYNLGQEESIIDLLTGEAESPIEIPGIDVFMSYNHVDLNVVRKLGNMLKDRGLRVWLDEWELVPGRPWQETLEDAIEGSKTVAVLIGEMGLGSWEIPEMRAALSESVRKGTPMIPILLPGAPSNPSLPLFLARYTWVDLRDGLTSEGIDRLEWGITGERPRVASR